MKETNTRIGNTGQYDIRAIRRLPSGDIAVLKISNKEAAKLKNHNSWTDILRRKSKKLRKVRVKTSKMIIADFNVEDTTGNIKNTTLDYNILVGRKV